MKRKMRLVLVAIATFILVFTFSSEKVEANDSGWSTYKGVTAKVYTDRSGYYPAKDTFIGATGKKTSAGGQVYYRMELMRYNNSNGQWSKLATQKGYMSGQTPMKKFYIDNYLNKGQDATFRVLMKLFSDSNYNNWIGDYFTPAFKVYN